MVAASIQDAEKILTAADKFVKALKPLIQGASPSHTFNTDQSGFQKELYSGRTLSNKGEKIVESAVQSVNATTHSYTIQPTISASGELLSSLPNKALLLLDSWNTYKDGAAIDGVKPAGQEVEIQTIPPKTTGLIQPLDRFFFSVDMEGLCAQDLRWNSSGRP